MDISIPAVYAYVLQACRQGIIVDLLSPNPRSSSKFLAFGRSGRRRSTPLPGGAIRSGGPSFLSVSPDTGVLPSLCAHTSRLPIGDRMAQAVLLGTELWLSVDVNDALQEARRVLSLEGLLAVLVGNTTSSTQSRPGSPDRGESTWWEPDVEEVAAILNQHFPYVMTLTIAEVSGCTLHDVRSNEKTEMLVSFPRGPDSASDASHFLFIATRRSRKLPTGLHLTIPSVGGRRPGDVERCVDMLWASDDGHGPKARVSAVDEGALDRLYREIEQLERAQQALEEKSRQSKTALEEQIHQRGAAESARIAVESELESTTRELEQAFKAVDALQKDLVNEIERRESAERGAHELERALTIAERRAIQSEVSCRRLRQSKEELELSLEEYAQRENQTELELSRIRPLAERERGRAIRAEAELERVQHAVSRERARREGLEDELDSSQQELTAARTVTEDGGRQVTRLEEALGVESEKRREAEHTIAKLLETLGIMKNRADQATEELNRSIRDKDDLVEEVAALRLELERVKAQGHDSLRGLDGLLGVEHDIARRGGSPALHDILDALANNRDLRTSMLRLMAVARDELTRKGQA